MLTLTQTTFSCDNHPLQTFFFFGGGGGGIGQSPRTAASCSSHLPQCQDGCPRVRPEPGLTRLPSSYKRRQDAPHILLQKHPSQQSCWVCKLHLDTRRKHTCFQSTFKELSEANHAEKTGCLLFRALQRARWRFAAKSRLRTWTLSPGCSCWREPILKLSSDLHLHTGMHASVCVCVCARVRAHTHTHRNKREIL